MTTKNYLKHIGIGTHLMFAFAALTVLITAILIKVIGIKAADQVKIDIGNSLAELAFQTTDKLDRGMFERYREVQLLATRAELANPQVPDDEKRRLLETLQIAYPYYAWIGLTDNQGKVLVASQKLLEGVDVSKRPWFGNAYKQIHLTDVHEAVLLAKLLPNPTGEPKRFFDVAFPYHDREGKIAGILGVHLSWQWASEVEKSVLRPLADRSRVETLIVSREGRVLLGPPALVEKTLSLPSLEAAAMEKSGFTVEEGENGRRYLVGYSQSQGYRTYPGMGWTVLVRQDLDVAYRPVVLLQREILIGGLLVAGLFSLLGWVASRRLARPLRSIAESAARIEAGDANAIETGTMSYRELNTLSGALNSLVRKLVTKEASLRELNLSLEKRVVERTRELEDALDVVRTSEKRTQAIIDTALDAFVGMDEHGYITDWNRQAENMFGWQRDEILGQPLATSIIPERFRQAHQDGLAHFLATGQAPVLGQRLQLFALRRNGEEFPIEMTIGLVRMNKGRFFGAFINDITERRKVEHALAESRERLTTITDNMPALISYVDKDERYQFNNLIYETWYQRPRHAILGRTLREVLGEEEYGFIQPYVRAALKGERAVFERQRSVNGETLHVESTFIPHRDSDGYVLGFYVMVHDVTERKNQELHFRHFATHDALTGLPNRRACIDVLQQAMDRVGRYRKPLSVLFLDLNRFKQINDTHGHETGDKVLIAFAERLRNSVRKTDVVARLAGDEFVVIAEGLSNGQEDAVLIAKKIISSLDQPVISREPTIRAATSIGIALFASGALTPEALLSRADSAMYQAKRLGGNTYSISMEAVD